MSALFERGRAAGQWTDELISECGFSSAEACLVHQEKAYQEELSRLSALYARSPKSAEREAEYLEGVITGARESLRGRCKQS